MFCTSISTSSGGALVNAHARCQVEHHADVADDSGSVPVYNLLINMLIKGCQDHRLLDACGQAAIRPGGLMPRERCRRQLLYVVEVAVQGLVHRGARRGRPGASSTQGNRIWAAAG